MLLLGYFEGLESERAMAWRAADSLSLRRGRIHVEKHEAVFTWVLQRAADAGLLKGKTVGIDATTLEATVALRSIVRRDTGEGYDAFLRGLTAASGIPTPTRAELARLDPKRRKKGANEDWKHPKDPGAQIMKMKDGRTHLAHKAEHAVDLETGAVVGVTVQDASAGDTTSMVETLVTAAEQFEAAICAFRSPYTEGVCPRPANRCCVGSPTPSRGAEYPLAKPDQPAGWCDMLRETRSARASLIVRPARSRVKNAPWFASSRTAVERESPALGVHPTEPDAGAKLRNATTAVHRNPTSPQHGGNLPCQCVLAASVPSRRVTMV